MKPSSMNNRFRNPLSSSSSLSSSMSRESTSSASSVVSRETEDSEFDYKMNNLNLQSKLNDSNFYCDITLEMIDDFLNPLSKKKPLEHKPKLTCYLPSATHGRGLSSQTNTSLHSSMSSLNSNDSFYRQANEENYLPFALREYTDEEQDLSYVNKVRTPFEKALIDKAVRKYQKNNEDQNEHVIFYLIEYVI